MFIRIMQLGIALYYGEIGSFKDGESEDLVCHTKDVLGNISGKCKLYFFIFPLRIFFLKVVWMQSCSLFVSVAPEKFVSGFLTIERNNYNLMACFYIVLLGFK